MTTDTRLWFAIEAAFSEIEARCVSARAALIVQQTERSQPKKAKTIKSTMVSIGDFGGLPAAPMAAPAAAPLTLPPGTPPAEIRQARAEQLARDLSFREQHTEGPDLIELRDRIRSQLKRLESQFAAVLGPHDLYYALFPLVILIDEMIRLGPENSIFHWEPLQSELFNISNGGDDFFLVLDDKLLQSQTPPLVLEIFYFCLAQGFEGAHQGDPARLEQYRQRIAARLPLRPVPLTAPVEPPRPVTLVRFPWAFYAAAVALVLTTHGLLVLLAPSP